VFHKKQEGTVLKGRQTWNGKSKAPHVSVNCILGSTSSLVAEAKWSEKSMKQKKRNQGWGYKNGNTN